MSTVIAGIRIPDGNLAREATDLLREHGTADLCGNGQCRKQGSRLGFWLEPVRLHAAGGNPQWRTRQAYR
jgi:hypothetical protein